MAKLVVVDVEADGPIPGEYSMIAFGAVIVEPGLKRTFKALLKPISNQWVPEALAVSGFSREETLEFDDPTEMMQKFADWLKENISGQPIFASDNNGFDWMFICWYFHKFLKRNPFGFSSRRIGDLYCGMKMSMFEKWKHLRRTVHDHDPVNDAKGNAEALLRMKEMGLKF